MKACWRQPVCEQVRFVERPHGEVPAMRVIICRSKWADYVLGAAVGIVVLATLGYIHGYPVRSGGLPTQIAFAVLVGWLSPSCCASTDKINKSFPVRYLTSNICKSLVIIYQWLSTRLTPTVGSPILMVRG